MTRTYVSMQYTRITDSIFLIDGFIYIYIGFCKEIIHIKYISFYKEDTASMQITS